VREYSRWPKFGPTRWPQHDYSSSGAYFITVISHRRVLIFDEPGVEEVVRKVWCEIPSHFSEALLDAFVVMPNHVHGIIVLGQGSEHAVVPQHAGALRGNAHLSVVVRSFKAAVTRELRIQGLCDDRPVWQPNYYDRVIRNEYELARIREYIAHNPIAWQYDYDNPERMLDEQHSQRWAWLENDSPHGKP
jgi:putative transposase